MDEDKSPLELSQPPAKIRFKFLMKYFVATKMKAGTDVKKQFLDHVERTMYDMDFISHLIGRAMEKKEPRIVFLPDNIP